MDELYSWADDVGRAMARGDREKVAFLLDLGTYFWGSDVGKKMHRKGEAYPKVGADTIAGALFVPGGLGYTIGKRAGYMEEKNRPARRNKRRR